MRERSYIFTTENSEKRLTRIIVVHEESLYYLGPNQCVLICRVLTKFGLMMEKFVLSVFINSERWSTVALIFQYRGKVTTQRCGKRCFQSKVSRNTRATI